jgi:signal transduction histidine kinase
LWSAHPAWALVEAWLIGLLILFALSRLAGQIDANALGNGTPLLCGVCGMWAVLRARVPGGAWWVQVLWEGAVGIALSVTMAGGLGLVVWLLGWQGVWRQSSVSQGLGLTLLAFVGPGYLSARAGVRTWLWWGRMRRQRMRWSLTHAHLVLTLIVVSVTLSGFLVVALIDGFRSDIAVAGQSGLYAALATRLLHTIFPAVGMALFFAGLVLLSVLLPSALFSFFVARRTTRRLEDLAAAASALRKGDYSARVVMAGEDEVAQLQADFNAMAGELQHTLDDLQTERDTVARLLQSRRVLVANVSHELRTPVATMRALLESVLARWQAAPPVSLRRDLEVMEGEVQRLQRLIDDLGLLAQTDAGGLSLEVAPTDVAAIVRRMVDAQAPLAWQSGRVQVVADVPGALPWADVDEARLEQVLANLVRNAVRHTPPGGIVAVAARAEERTVQIEVRDTGEGIMPEDLPHIWERFYRGQNVRGQGGRGAGLGLALVKELIEAMGGTVEVESVMGQGSCFKVTVPKSE